jgi:hypothetical protein
MAAGILSEFFANFAVGLKGKTPPRPRCSRRRRCLRPRFRPGLLIARSAVDAEAYNQRRSPSPNPSHRLLPPPRRPGGPSSKGPTRPTSCRYFASRDRINRIPSRPPADRSAATRGRRIDNPPQVENLPHNSSRRAKNGMDSSTYSARGRARPALRCRVCTLS